MSGQKKKEASEKISIIELQDSVLKLDIGLQKICPIKPGG
jgi:hypothetical protein